MPSISVGPPLATTYQPSQLKLAPETPRKNKLFDRSSDANTHDLQAKRVRLGGLMENPSFWSSDGIVSTVPPTHTATAAVPHKRTIWSWTPSHTSPRLSAQSHAPRAHIWPSEADQRQMDQVTAIDLSDVDMGDQDHDEPDSFWPAQPSHPPASNELQSEWTSGMDDNPLEDAVV